MNFLETSQALNREDIAKVENELDILFPKDFVSHYLEYNGGYPEYDQYTWPDEGTTRVNSFFPIKYDKFGKIETVYHDLVIIEKYLPKGVVPFATDDGGNFFCISTRDKDYGNVYYVNNDNYDPNDVDSAFSILEASFKQFLDKLS